MTAPHARGPGGLGPIVAALGGDLYAGGRRANVPAPGHSAHDRSISLLLDGDRVVVYAFGDGDWRQAMAAMKARGLIDAEGRVCGGGGPGAPLAAAPPAAERVRHAAQLWETVVALMPGSAATRHVRRRGVERALAGLSDLRALSAAPVSVYRPGRARRPALLAAVRAPDGRLTAVEITYLDAAGRRATDLHLSRKVVGVLPSGAAVRLDPVGPSLLVAEGVFTALSASQLFGWPCWALLSTSNLRRWRAPPGVRRVLVAGDPGADGERCAGGLAAALRAQGVAVDVRLPPAGVGDWNDVLCAGG